MTAEAVSVLRDTLSAHRETLVGAQQRDGQVDLDRVEQVHDGLFRILAHWDEYTANQQRQIIKTIECVVNTTGEHGSDLVSRGGLADDLDRLHRLQDALGYR